MTTRSPLSSVAFWICSDSGWGAAGDCAAWARAAASKSKTEREIDDRQGIWVTFAPADAADPQDLARATTNQNFRAPAAERPDLRDPASRSRRSPRLTAGPCAPPAAPMRRAERTGPAQGMAVA